MSADALAGWLAAEPVNGLAGSSGYMDLYNDDADNAMPPLEADTAFHLSTVAASTAVLTPTATATAAPSLSLPLPAVPASSSFVIQQTTHIERTVRTEVRASPSLSASHITARPATDTTAASTPELNGLNRSSTSSSLPRSVPSPHPTPSPAATPLARAAPRPGSSNALTTPSYLSAPSLAPSPPLPDLIPPPASASFSSITSASSPVSSLPVSLSSPSSSLAASTALLADSDPTDEFLEDEGLHPRFSPWAPVSSPMPSQSYSAYLDTCERTLPADALAALRLCAPGDPTAENTHADPFPLLREPQHDTQAFTVLQRADGEHGLLQYKLVARRRIHEKEVIGFVAGHLETEHEAEREGVDRMHPSHIHINRGYLHKYLGCSHPGSLVLSLKRFHNPLHHLRDPALFLSDSDEKRPEVSAYNVHVDLLLDPERRVPVVIAYAWVDIEEGQELTAYLGLGVWYSRDHQRLFLASRVNHWFHRKVADIERLLDDKKIDFQKQLSKKHASTVSGGKRSASTASSATKQQKDDSKAHGKDSKGVAALETDPPGPVLSAADEWRFLDDEEKREEAIAKWHREQAGLNKGMEKVELWKVFALSQCAYVNKVFVGKSVSEHTKAAWQQLPDFIPAHIAVGNEVIDVDPAAIRRLVETGHDETLCEVREVTSLISPVRYYSAPWHPAFCVVARKLIKKGTFVFTYSGELEQEIRNRDSVYVYDVQADNIRAHWPACPADLPDMVIDAEKYGGVARFVNDSRYRLHEGLAEGEAENLNHTFVFVDRCIHLCFYVTKDVKAREELVSTYGDEFWSVCTGQMLIQHRQYYNHINHYHQQLSALLHSHALPLPEPPSHLLELQPLFQRKVALYPAEPSPTDTAATEEEWEVEYILSKGRMSRETHYLVKWLGFDDSYNSWVKKREMACTQLIQRFEQQLAQENETAAHGGSRASKGSKRKGSNKGAAKQRRRGEGKEEKGVETPDSEDSSSRSGSESDGDKQSRKARRKTSKTKKRRKAERAAADSSETAADREERRRKGKLSQEQREANRQRIRETINAARANKHAELLTAGGAASPAVLDESTDTEEELADNGGAISVSEAPLLPPIVPLVD